MMKSKFFLKRLVLGGNNKKNAILNFEEGLNVIAVSYTHLTLPTIA